jgi:hypothetical protein
MYIRIQSTRLGRCLDVDGIIIDINSFCLGTVDQYLHESREPSAANRKYTQVYGGGSPPLRRRVADSHEHWVVNDIPVPVPMYVPMSVSVFMRVLVLHLWLPRCVAQA